MNATLKSDALSAMLGRPAALLCLAGMFLMVTRAISDVSFGLAGKIYPAWRWIDPDGAFLSITLHHVFQAAIAFAAILALVKVLRLSLADFGFNTKQWRYAVRRVLQFGGAWFVLQGSIATAMMLSGTTPAPFPFPLSAANFGGHLLFQVLLSGTSEEILYRSLVITSMLALGRRLGYGERTNVILAVTVVTVCFMFGHVNFQLSPFRITYFNWLQQVTVVIFGLFYAFLFVRTRSLVGPILAHNLLNGVVVTIGLLVILTFG